MKSNKLNTWTPAHLGDWIIDCDICGTPCWYSEATLLTVETGEGGCLVCPRDRDAIDPGLIPYKIRGERPVDTTRINNFNDVYNIPGATPFNSQNNPLGQDIELLPQQWQNVISTWETIYTNWENM